MLRRSVSIVAVGLSVLVGACSVDLSVPETAVISCASEADCPDEYACSAATHTCARGGGNLDPAVSLETPARGLGSLILSFTLSDPNAPPFGDDQVSVSFTYSVDGATFCPVTTLDRSPTALDALAAGLAYTVTWSLVAEANVASAASCPLPTRQADTDGDGLGDTTVLAFVPTLTLRAVPSDTSVTPLSGAGVERGPFAAGNAFPALELALAAGSYSRLVPVPFRLTQEAGDLDLAAMELAFHAPDDLPGQFHPARVEFGSTSGLPTDGAEQVIVWNSIAASALGGIGARNAPGVVLRMRAHDEPVPGTLDFGPWLEVTVDVENQSPPRVEYLAAEIDAPGRASGAVTVMYRLADTEGDAADVRVEYAIDDATDWFACTELPVPTSEGRYDLATRSARGGAVVHRFVWDPVADVGSREPTSIRLRVTPADRYAGVGVGTVAAVSGTVGLQTSNSDTTSYGLAFRYAMGSASATVALLDSNADGLQDVLADAQTATTLYRGGGVTGVGDGSLGAGDSYAIPASSYRLHRVVVRDLDADGREDLVLNTGLSIDVYRASAATGWLVKDGAASFAISRDGMQGLAVGDLDGDGRLDIAYTDGSHVRVAVGQANQTFVLDPNGYPLTSLAVPRIATGDFNGDGKDDLAALAWIGAGAEAQVVICPGRARVLATDPVLDTSVTLAEHFQGHDWDTAVEDEFRNVEIAAGDVDADAYDDLAVADVTLAVDGRVSLYLGSDAGLAALVPGGVIRGWPTHLRLVDVDGDGKREILSASQRLASGARESGRGMIDIQALRQPTRDRLDLVDRLVTTSTCASSYYFDFDARDLDGDHRADIDVLWSCPATSHLDVWLSTSSPALPNAAFGTYWRGETGAAPTAIHVTDVDADGALDVLWGDPTLDSALVLQGRSGFDHPTGRLALVAANQMSLGGVVSLHSYGFGDVNGDAVPDAILSDIDFCRLGVLPTARPQALWDYSVSASFAINWGICMRWFIATDVTDDGLADIITADGPLYAYVPQRTGGVFNNTFAVSTLATGGTNLGTSAAVADLNADGILDIAASGNTVVSIVFGRGSGGKSDGTFAAACSVNVATTLQATATGDFDDDGLGEILVARSDGATGSLLELVQVAPAGCSTSVASAGTLPLAVKTAFADDVTGDGVLDVVFLAADTDRHVLVAEGATTAGAANGTFRAAVDSGLPPSIVAVHTADMNGDGVLDLVGAGAAVKPANTPDLAIYVAPGRRWNRWDTWGRTLTGPEQLGAVVAAGVDAFGEPYRASIGLRRYRATEPVQDGFFVGRDFAARLRRSGLATARDNRLAPLTRAYEVFGDLSLIPDPQGETGRWQVGTRLGRDASGAVAGLDLDANPERGVLIELPIIPARASLDLSAAGVEMHVFLRVKDLGRADAFPDDPLAGTAGGASYLPRTTDYGTGLVRGIYREAFSWSELPRAAADDLANGPGPRFVLDHSGPRPSVRVALDRLGVVQAFYVAR
ncbi:MAG: VCBS repeat-containing protein [Deltaproteobacteria bacterium]|nr:VCBS repeat-containing protein [Deltaproteobacteria bacterium]